MNSIAGVDKPFVVRASVFLKVMGGRREQSSTASEDTPFASLPDHEPESLARSLGKRTFGKGMILFHRGSPDQTPYIIESGVVRIFFLGENGQEITVNPYGPGERLRVQTLAARSSYGGDIENGAGGWVTGPVFFSPCRPNARSTW